MKMKQQYEKIRIDFSFKREVFFVVTGALIGAMSFGITETVFQVLLGLPYYLVWFAFGHVAGVFTPISASIVAGVLIHVLTSISIDDDGIDLKDVTDNDRDYDQPKIVSVEQYGAGKYPIRIREGYDAPPFQDSLSAFRFKVAEILTRYYNIDTTNLIHEVASNG